MTTMTRMTLKRKHFFSVTFMIEFEKYRGAKSKHTCPSCGKPRKFSRFINTETGEHLPDNVGICDRASSCGYRYTPKQFFADHPTGSNFKPKAERRADSFNGNVNQTGTLPEARAEGKTFDVIPFASFKATLGGYASNNFVHFLLNLFPDDAREIEDILKMYCVGSFEDYTCFPSIDAQNRICRAKLIRFNPDTGNRLKGDYDTSALPAKLKLKDFNYKQIFFGEHLLSKYPDKPVGVVEAEKTAIIAGLCFPEFVWLGCNSKTWLKAERLQRMENRQIILYPDADGDDTWQEIASQTQRGLHSVQVSKLIENHAQEYGKPKGYDLADYLIEKQTEINAHNRFVDKYNASVEKVLRNENLFHRFNRLLDERQAHLMLYGGMNKDEAEKRISDLSFVRDAVLKVADGQNLK